MIKYIKTTIAAISITTLAFTLTPFTAFAGNHSGSHNKRHNSYTQYSICNIENCNITEVHTHNNSYYYGHTLNDGHDYHNSDFNHYAGDGHSYHYSEHSGISNY